MRLSIGLTLCHDYLRSIAADEDAGQFEDGDEWAEQEERVARGGGA